MEIKAGMKARIYCLSDKPEGKITSVGNKNVIIELDRGTMTVDKDDIIEENGILQVLNYVSLNENEPEEDSADMSEEEIGQKQFVEDMMNIVKTMPDGKEKNLYNVFMHYIKSAVDKNGMIYPLPCVFSVGTHVILGTEKKGIAMAGLAVPVPQVYSAASVIVGREKPTELLFGSYLENMPNSGIDPKYKNVFLVFRMKRGTWMYGVVGYNNNKDLNQETDWDNAFWTSRMKALLGTGGAIEIPQKIGTAYNNKINVKIWRETQEGYFYEGDIIESKLDAKTKKFIKDNNLDTNDKKQITNFFDEKNIPLVFKNRDGFVNLTVSNTKLSFLDRRSKTRAILEALESVANNTKIIPKS